MTEEEHLSGGIWFIEVTEVTEVMSDWLWGCACIKVCILLFLTAIFRVIKLKAKKITTLYKKVKGCPGSYITSVFVPR